MFLAIRMVLYAAFAMLAGQGFEFYDAETQTVTIHVDDLAQILAGAGGYFATFLLSFRDKVRGPRKS